MQKAVILIQAFLFSLNLNIISPLINDISKFYNLEGIDGYFYIGGFNTILIFFPMALSSLFYSFYRRNFNLLYLNFLIAACNLFLSFKFPIFFFYLSNIGIGISIGFAIPIIYKLAKKLVNNEKSIDFVVYINIVIGVGLISGQYLSAIAVDYLNLGWELVFLILSLIFFTNSLIIFYLNKNYYNLLDTQKELNHSKEYNSNPIFKRKNFLLLSQYLPGAIPWGALTVYIFPYLLESNIFNKVDIVNFVTCMALGMIFGSLIASQIQKTKIGNSERKILVMILVTLILSTLFVIELIQNLKSISFYPLLILFFLTGIVLSFPGTYIKGLLFLNNNPNETQTIFAFENFLESLGKGLGPLISGIIIIKFQNFEIGFIISCCFWLLCSIPITILIYSNKQTK